MSHKSVKEFLDRFYMSRIGIRFLCEAVVVFDRALRDQLARRKRAREVGDRVVNFKHEGVRDLAHFLETPLRARAFAIRDLCLARCGDDVFDCLAGPITVEDSILREGWDKGMSLLNNDLTITNTQIIKCDKAIVPKSQNADTRTVTAANCTIVSENHDTTQGPWGYAILPTSP